MLFDRVFFDDRLVAVEVRWSKRMTVCAGLCAYEGRGGLCRISLSESLLQFRSRKELVVSSGWRQGERTCRVTA